MATFKVGEHVGVRGLVVDRYVNGVEVIVTQGRHVCWSTWGGKETYPAMAYRIKLPVAVGAFLKSEGIIQERHLRKLNEEPTKPRQRKRRVVKPRKPATPPRRRDPREPELVS